MEKNIQAMQDTTATWLNALEQYSEEQFAAKPHETAWSIGQVYAHLLGGTERFFISKMRECLDDPKDEDKEPNERAKYILEHNVIPPIRIKGNPNAPQPSQKTIAETRSDFEALRPKLDEIGNEIGLSTSQGRAEHPAFGFMNAVEWYRYCEMHFRHHFHQKERLDQWLAGAEYELNEA